MNAIMKSVLFITCTLIAVQAMSQNLSDDLSELYSFSADRLFVNYDRYYIAESALNSLKGFPSTLQIPTNIDYAHSYGSPSTNDALYAVDWYLADDTLYIGNVSIDYRCVLAFRSEHEKAITTFESLSGQRRKMCDTLPVIANNWYENLPCLGYWGLVKANWVNGIYYVKHMPKATEQAIKANKEIFGAGVETDKWLLEPYIRLTIRNGVVVERIKITSNFDRGKLNEKFKTYMDGDKKTNAPK